MEFLVLKTDLAFAQALADWTPSTAGMQSAVSATSKRLVTLAGPD